MKVFIFSTVGLICLIFIQINADRTDKKCGGFNTEVKIKKKHTKNEICSGQQIHSRAIITVAHCIEGVDRKQLLIVKNYHTPESQEREVSLIFTHPVYSRCLVMYDLVILILEEPFTVQYDLICLENNEIIDSDPHRDCQQQVIEYVERQRHYEFNDLKFHHCLSPTNSSCFVTNKYFTEFKSCSFHKHGSSELIKSLYSFYFWSDYSETDPKEFEYKLYHVKIWIDLILQHALPTFLSNSSLLNIINQQMDESARIFVNCFISLV